MHSFIDHTIHSIILQTFYFTYIPFKCHPFLLHSIDIPTIYIPFIFTHNPFLSFITYNFTYHYFLHTFHFYIQRFLHTIHFYTLYFYLPFTFTYHHTLLHTIHTQFTHNTLYSLFSGMKTRIQRSKTNVFSHMKELKEEALSKEQDCYKLNNGIRIQEQNKKVRERNDVILRIVQEYEERERLHYLRAIANQFNIKF